MVWLPMLPSDDRDAAEQATETLNGVGRAWWDAERVLAEAWSAPLALARGAPAWDVYLVLGPNAAWGEQAPAPSAWWHYLHGGPPAHRAGSALADDIVRAAEGLLPAR